MLITAIGVSYLLQNAALIVFGGNPKSFSSVVNLPWLEIRIGSLLITDETVVTVSFGLADHHGWPDALYKKDQDWLRRASCFEKEEDKGAAQLMGVNVDRTIAITFAIGSALAAVAGVLLCSSYPTLKPDTGAMPGIKAFVAAVFGGIGSVPGAMLGGILLGIIENLSRAYISSQMADAIVFAVLIVVLLVKPTGLLGKKIHEKV